MSARPSRARSLFLTVALAVAVAPFLGEVTASATTGPVATTYPGNIHDGKAGTACSQLGFPDDTEVAVGNSSGYDSGGITVTSDGQYLTVVSLPADTQVDVLVVKGGDAYNVYDSSQFSSLPASGFHAPVVGGDNQNVPTISHWFLCAGPVSEQPPVVVPETGSVTGDCTTATVTMDAGSDDGSFRIDPAGSESASDQSVTAATEKIVHVAVDADNPTVTLLDTSGETSSEIDSYTRPSGCDEISQNGIDPKATFSTACASGISVTLSNMKLDDTTTLPVTFTITTPAGKTETVTVKADHIVKKSYAVTEDTTGVVTVSAPGMSTISKSYAKNCTKVLGEKVVKDPTKVLGEKVSRLPMTGMSPWAMLGIATALLMTGVALQRTGLRPVVAVRRGRHRI